jgi:hypothetical protein
MGALGKCAPCFDRAITDGDPDPEGSAPDAVVLVTVVQQFPAGGGQQVAAPCLIGVCTACRKAQLGTVSRSGLVTA